MQVVDQGRSLTQLADAANELVERDRPLLRAMLASSLRWHHRYAWQLDQLLDRPQAKLDRELAALLRIGLTQLQALRIPEHAAVSATVAASSLLGVDRGRGLVNAVLRRFIRERDVLEQRMPEHAAANFSHPEWLIDALRRDWPGQWQDILRANNELPPLWLRVNCRRIDRSRYLSLLESSGFEATGSNDCPEAVLMAEPVPVERLPGFGDGLVSVQDVAAQRAADLMRLEPGLRVLDACAAPGGKAAHLLERCSDLAELVAVDSDCKRLEQVRENLDRLGLEATLVAGDALQAEDWAGGSRFDRVLVDAPCSATGVIRRHPDIKLLRRPTDPERLAEMQVKLLAALWPLLAPGGRLVYSTCSVLKIENLSVVEAFAEGTADARLAAFGSAEHFRIPTGETNADGFYYACLTRAAGT